MNRRSFFRGLAALAAGCGLVKRTPVEPVAEIADATWKKTLFQVKDVEMIFHKESRICLASMTSRVDADGIVRVA